MAKNMIDLKKFQPNSHLLMSNIMEKFFDVEFRYNMCNPSQVQGGTGMKVSMGLLIILFMAVLCLPGCAGKTENPDILSSSAGSRVPVISPADPYTWFDKPLNGFTITQDTYEIIFHGSAIKGIAVEELYINDNQVVSANNPAPGKTLATMKYPWTPPQPGQYVLRARTMDTENQWSDPALVTVNVIGSTTTTPTVTLVPTVTPTPTGTVEAFAVTKSTGQFYYGGSTCGPTSITLEALVGDPMHVKGVTLFFHLQDNVSGNKTAWNYGLVMHPESDSEFTATVLSSTIPGYSTYPQSILLYQFVGTDAGNNVLVRSQVYGDVILSGCGTQSTAVDCSQYKNDRSCNANPACTWSKRTTCVKK
jgi:hypothetical protein